MQIFSFRVYCLSLWLLRLLSCANYFFPSILFIFMAALFFEMLTIILRKFYIRALDVFAGGILFFLRCIGDTSSGGSFSTILQLAAFHRI